MKYKTRNEKVVVKARNYLIAIRAEKDLSQGDISNRAGIIQSTYSRIENGYKGALMCARQLIALADALVKEMVASGELKAFLVKKRLRISQAMLDEYIMSHTVDKK